jgi:hypothetical protein
MWNSRRYALVFALLAACGSTAVVGQDSGAPEPDASLPAGDAGPAKDSGAVDASSPRVDSGLAGSWRPMPGAPARCKMELSDTPEVSAPHMQWQDCAPPATCRFVAENWRVTKLTSSTLLTQGSENIFASAGKLYFHYTRMLDDQVGYSINVVEELGRDTLFAAYSPNDFVEACTATIAASPHGVGFFAFSSTVDNPAQVDFWAGWSSLAAPLALSIRSISTAETGVGPATVPGRLSFGPNALHMEAAGLSLTRVFTLDTATKALSYAATNPPVMGTELPRWTPTRVMVIGDQAPYSLRFMPVGGGNTVVVAPSAGYNVTFAGLDRARGNALVWLETQEGAVDRKNLTLYTAPYAESAGAATKRKVAMLPDPNQSQGVFFTGFVANADMVLTVTSGTNARLIRLSDGMGWNIAPQGPVTAFTTALYVDDDSVYLGFTDDPNKNRINQKGVIRIPRASLGEPTIPSGL